jgi:hypothetical protein
MAMPAVPESAAAPDEKIARPPTAMPLAARVSIVVATGLLMGAATSILQKYLGSPWGSLANAISPWLTPAFVLGALWRGPKSAALAGAATGLLELAGYYLTAAARGYSVSHGILLFWTAGAVVGGPIFGVAGWSWWRGQEGGRRRLRGLGAAVLPAAFLAEATVSYGWELHYSSSAILFAVLGAVAFALVGLRGRQHARAALWLLAAFPAGAAAELLLGLIYRQSF